jgi:SAM-dependent methyltransferase
MDLRERAASATTRHPWELVRADFFERLLADRDLLDAARWLDVGAGDAWFATELVERLRSDATVTCWDINYTTEDLAALGRDDGRVVLAAERPTSQFDRITLLDVIEHVEDDAGFLGGIVRDLLAPGGSVLISVPAYQPLFSRHDTALGHFRRYSPAQLRAVATGAGLEVDAEGGLFASLLGARAIAKAAERARPDPGEWTGVGAWSGGPMVTRVTITALALDASTSRLLARRHLRMPGLSCWALCRRRGG